MTNEEAAKRLEEQLVKETMYWGNYFESEVDREVAHLAIAALRSGWVRTSERLPTATDEVGGMVVTATRVPCFDGLGEIIEIRQAYAVIRGGETRYNYWMALPKLPNMEDEA